MVRLPVALYGCETWSLTFRKQKFLYYLPFNVNAVCSPPSTESNGKVIKNN